MTLARIYAGLKSIAALSGLIAFVSFAINYQKDVQIRQAAVSQSWQEGEIYRVVLAAGVEGLTFEEIVSKVRTAYFDTGAAATVSTGVGQEDAVRRALVALSSKNAVVIDTSGRYLVPTVARNYLTQDLLFSRRQELDEKAFALVLENPGRFSSIELRQQLMDDGATAREAWQVVGSALFMNPPAFVPAAAQQYSPESKLKVLE